MTSSTTHDGDDDLDWGSSKKQPVDSAFSDPAMITDISNEPSGEGEHHEHQETYTEEHVNEAGTTEAASAAKNGKPNVAILALVGLLGLSVLGGAGWLVNKQINKKSVRARDAEIALVVPAVTSVQASPDAAPTSTVAPVSIFESSSSTTTMVVTSASGTQPEQGGFPSSKATTSVSSSTSVPVASPVLPVIVIPAPTVAAVVVPSTKVVVAEVKPAEPVVKPVTVKTKRVTVQKKSEEVVVAQARPRAQQVASAKFTRKKRNVSTRIAAKKKSGSKQELAKSEEFVLSSGLKVLSIFPISGPNAQAWVADSTGSVQVVRVGENLKSGAQVIGISGEKGEVTTVSGVISTKGATK